MTIKNLTEKSHFTKEQLIEHAQRYIAHDAWLTSKFGTDHTKPATVALAEIALAVLIAAPVGAFHIANQQVDGTTDYIKDGEWPVDNGVIEVYRLPPMEGLITTGQCGICADCVPQIDGGSGFSNCAEAYAAQMDEVLVCDMCGHDAWLQENGEYECDEGHIFEVNRTTIIKGGVE
ncbi:hypothetical protein [Salmonella enterica]|uniref:hypothetical protein n=1 Tax=Salmonella enterica TaxID=28901 RepID=UPI003AAF38CD